MREHDLQPRRRRRYVATTDSDHDQPIYPNRAKDLAIDGPDQLWVADITYVAIREGFAYVAVILDAWSRRAIGYAISRSIDVRLTLAALNMAVERRKPPPGCIHHSDRGSQYAAQGYREALLRHGLVGSMGRRGNPYDNPKAESFMKTLKVEAVYPMAYETFADVADDLPQIHRQGLQRSSSPLSAGLSQPAAVRGSQSPADGQISRLILSAPRGPLQIGGQSSTPIDIPQARSISSSVSRGCPRLHRCSRQVGGGGANGWSGPSDTRQLAASLSVCQ